MIINHNLNAMNAHRQLSFNTVNAGKSMEKLSSGLRINRAGDDAAGLAISEKMRAQIRGLEQAARNAQDGISLIQTAEGALNETHAILQRMRVLAAQAANDTNVEVDRKAIKTEIDQLAQEIDRIGNTTQFNKQNLLDGSFGVKLKSASTLKSNSTFTVSVNGMKANTSITLGVTAGTITASDTNGNTQVIKVTDIASASNVAWSGTVNFDKLGLSITVSGASLSKLNELVAATSGTAAQNLLIGANSGQKLAISINDMRAEALGVNKLNVDSYANANESLDAIQNAIEKVSTERATLGAWQNRLEHTINNLNTSSENLQASESRIRDVDMAKEMMTFSKNNILAQAAQAMLAQANQQPQGVLQLLR